MQTTGTDCPDCWANAGEPHWPDCAIQRAETSTRLAKKLALDPRFAARDGSLFEEYSKTFGRDVAGFAWVQACLAVDRGAV